MEKRCSSLIKATDKNGEEEKNKTKKLKTRLMMEFFITQIEPPSANQYTLGLVSH